jgi:trimethylamine--corrinoid protein Co-methyltransferase
LFGFFANCQSPLIHLDAELTCAFWAADHGIPVVYLGGGTSGVTAPITGAGTLVVSLAAALSGLAIIQLHKRGAPVCVGSVPTPLDPRTARPAYGAPELSLFSAALGEVYRYLELPFMGTAGATDAKSVDAQAAVESAMQVIFALLGGHTLPHDIGMLDCANIGSLEMLALTDEIIGMARQITRGIEVSDETLMLDVIDRVGPGGEFMSCEETVRRLRGDIWISTLMDRQPWESWAASGALTLSDRVRARVAHILQNHRPMPLPEGAAAQIDAILQEAEAR